MTPAEYHANGVITKAEAEALELQAAGLSQRQAALALRLSRAGYRARIENARRKIADAERTAA
jgi:predicted DNA-binding protein (UPF0251 family)